MNTEVTSAKVARLAARVLKNPKSLKLGEVEEALKILAASCLTQRPGK
jgi:hypothetical protein